jgi:hypothetical protein
VSQSGFLELLKEMVISGHKRPEWNNPIKRHLRAGYITCTHVQLLEATPGTYIALKFQLSSGYVNGSLKALPFN